MTDYNAEEESEVADRELEEFVDSTLKEAGIPVSEKQCKDISEAIRMFIDEVVADHEKEVAARSIRGSY